MFNDVQWCLMMFDDVRSAFRFPILFFFLWFSRMPCSIGESRQRAPWWPSTAVPGDTRTAWISWINGRRTRRGFRCDGWRSWTTLVQVDSSKVRRMHLWWSDHVLYPSKHGLLVNPPLMRGLLPLKPPCIRDFPLPRLMTGNQFVIIPYTSLNIFIDQNDSHQPWLDLSIQRRRCGRECPRCHWLRCQMKRRNLAHRDIGQKPRRNHGFFVIRSYQSERSDVAASLKTISWS